MILLFYRGNLPNESHSFTENGSGVSNGYKGEQTLYRCRKRGDYIV